MSQVERVLDHLIESENHSITSMDAFRLFGITRLAAVVYDMRKLGYEVETVEEVSKNMYDEPTRYARYYLKSEEKRNASISD